MNEQYYIDWINSLDISGSIFINNISELYKNNRILLTIIAIILNKKIDELINDKEYQNLNYMKIIEKLMKKYFNYIYVKESSNNTILLLQFLKSIYPHNKNNFSIEKNMFINIQPIRAKNKKSNNNNNTTEAKIKKEKEKKFNLKNSHTALNIEEEEQKNQNTEIIIDNKKEEFILNYLYKLGIITSEQKNGNYLWKKFIPDLKDGYIIGKLINIFENKNNDYLKGISKETFYQINLYLNWKKIKDFLINKESFNSIYLYDKNLFKSKQNLFNFLYDLCNYYHHKKIISINNNKICQKSKSMTKINISSKSKYSKIKYIKDCINLNNISTKEDIFKIRKNIFYMHKNNNKNNNNKKCNTISDNENKKEVNDKDNTNNKFIMIDINKIKKIKLFFDILGINSSQINFSFSELKLFRDGTLFFQIISKLDSGSTIIPKIDFNPKKEANAINNLRLIINYLVKYKNNFSIKYMGKEKELYKAKTEFIIEFLNEIIKVYKNEIYFLEKTGLKGEFIKLKNIDKSERLSLPMDKNLRKTFLIKDKNKIWA